MNAAVCSCLFPHDTTDIVSRDRGTAAPDPAIPADNTISLPGGVLYRQQPSIAYVKHAFGEERNSSAEVLNTARLRFEHLRSLALDPDQSVARIEQVSGELWSG